MEGKQYEAKLGNNTKRQMTKPLEIVHLDVCGLMRNMFVGRVKYFITFIDDFSRNVWVYMIKSKG